MANENGSVGPRPPEAPGTAGTLLASRDTYVPPALTRLGDLRTMTMGTTPSYADSGGPPGLGRRV